MHIGLRSILATAGIGLALAPAAFADTGTETLVLARDDCGGTDNTRLDWSVGASTTGCGNLAAGLAPVIGSSPESYPSAGDVAAFAIDQSRAIVVDVSISSFTGNPLGGIGAETITVDLSGKTVTPSKTVAIGTASYTTGAQDELRNGQYVHEFTVPIPAALAGATLKSVNLDLSVDGAALGGFVNTDGNSLVAFPIPGDVDASPPDTGA